MTARPVSKRLWAALALSCLLHAIVVVLPDLEFGTGSSTGAQRIPAGSLSARIEPLIKPETTDAAETPAAKSNSANASPAANGTDTATSNTAVPLTEAPAPEQDPGIGLLPTPAPIYYPPDQLTRRPQPATSPRLAVPPSGPAFTSGKVILKLWISRLGRVVKIEIAESSVPAAIAESAVAVFKKLRFSPGEIDGQRVAALLWLEVTYDEAGNEGSRQIP